jgi:hypothetical protein
VYLQHPECLVSTVTRPLTRRRGSISGSAGPSYSPSCPDRFRGPPTLLFNGYRSPPSGIKWLGQEAKHSPPTSAVVKNLHVCVDWCFVRHPKLGHANPIHIVLPHLGLSIAFIRLDFFKQNAPLISPIHATPPSLVTRHHLFTAIQLDRV